MDRINLVVCCSDDTIGTKAAIDEGFVVLIKMVDDCGLVVNHLDTIMRNAKAPWAAITKVFRRNEHETICGEAEVEVDADMGAAIEEAEARTKFCKRRQGSPATIIAT